MSSGSDQAFIDFGNITQVLLTLRLSEATLYRIAAEYRKNHGHDGFLCHLAENYDTRCSTCKEFDRMDGGK